MAGATVTFTDTSTPVGTIASWLWDFGDSSTSTLQNPVHVYAADGTYTARLTVIGVYGATSTVTHAVDVHAASFQVTTTGVNQTLTINSFGISQATVIDWGDASTSTYTGTALRTHLYAVAGTYTVKIYAPANVTTFDMRDNKVTLNSANIATMFNVQTFIFVTPKAGTFNSIDVTAWRPTRFTISTLPTGYLSTLNSADMINWRPDNFSIATMPAGSVGVLNSADFAAWRPSVFSLMALLTGYTGVINSADFAAWNPTMNFSLGALPVGITGTFNTSDLTNWTPDVFSLLSLLGMGGAFNSAHLSSWNPTTFRFQTMPTPAFTFTLSVGGFAIWTKITTFSMSGNALLQAQVNQIIFDFYTAFPARTVTAGAINVAGTNAAPSGLLLPGCPPLTGKQAVYELVNDSCAVSPTHKWSTVTITP